MAQLDKIRLSGTTYDIIDATAVHSLDGYYTTGETNAAITAATNALAESIAEMNYATTGYVQDAIAEASGVTTGTVQSMIDSSISGKTDNVDFTGHTADTSAHTTTAEKEAWNAKADLSDIPSVTGYADSVKYNSTSKYVEFYHGGTGGTKVFEYDASPFLIDGMVQNVEIKDVTISGESVTCLVISFNTDAGKQDINIPLTAIFDPTNYYTKSEVDSALSAKTDNADFTAYTSTTDTVISNKADTTAMTQAITEATSGKANSSDVYLKTETSGSTELSTAFSNKQDTLVSQTNIKSINGSSILGSGDLTVDTGLHAEVTGTTLIFS